MEEIVKAINSLKSIGVDLGEKAVAGLLLVGLPEHYIYRPMIIEHCGTVEPILVSRSSKINYYKKKCQKVKVRNNNEFVFLISLVSFTLTTNEWG